MAHINQDRKQRLLEAVRTTLAKYPEVELTYTARVHNYSALYLTITRGNVFSTLAGEAYSINPYWFRDNPPTRDGLTLFLPSEHTLLCELFDALNSENYDKSDVQSDYFDVGYYIDLAIGEWRKPYFYTGEEE